MRFTVLFLVTLMSVALATPTTCSQTDVVLTVGQAMPQITCAGYDNMIAYPPLPEGIKMENNIISGSPLKAQQYTEYLIVPNVRFDSDIAVRIKIAVVGTCSRLSYGFNEIKIYQGLLIEPIGARSDCHLNTWSVTPALPSGLTLDPTSGLITGTATTLSTMTSYTVTASNGVSTQSTTFKIQILNQNEMLLAGLTGCYYTSMSGCMNPTLFWFRTHDAKICQRETDINFSDEYSSSTGGHAWPGLDDRFRDFLSAVYSGYLVINQAGEYTFKVTSDDGATLFIDNFDVPVVDNGGCHGDKTTEATITLTPGKHVIFITYFDMNYGSRLGVWYRSESLNIPETVLSQANTRVGGRGPSFLHYNTINAVVGSQIHTAYPTFASGAATEYTSTPALPGGLSIDSRGLITGVVNTPVSGTYTIKMTGTLGYTEYAVKINIVSTPIAGIRGNYYKITDSGDICEYKMFGELILNHRISRIDADINHPDLNGNAVWTGLSPDMADRIYAEWEGYLFIDTVGIWELGGQSDDGWRLYINNEQFHESWQCQGMNRIMKTIEFSRIGYYPIKIQYFEDIYGHGILFEWKRPFTSTIEVIPSSFFFHTPSSPLTYSYTRMNFFVNAPIDPIKPIWFGASSTGSYSVTPTLPAGLTINSSTGIITGTPSTAQAYLTYTITNGANSATISITVSSVTPPSNYRYEFNNAVVGSSTIELQFDTFFEMKPLFDGTMFFWSVTPTLPTGIYVESYSGWLKGTPKQSLNTAATYTINGCNSAGCATTTVTLRVPGCNNGNYYFTKLISGTATIRIMQGNTEVSTASGSAGTYKHCFTQGTFNHKVECTSASGCDYTFYRDDMAYVLGKSLQAGSTATPTVGDTSFSSSITSPSFTLSASSVSGYKLQKINPIKFNTQTYWTTFTFTPALPRTASINLELGQLEGSWPEVGTYSYSITMTNPMGVSSSQSLTVTISTCGADKTLVTFERYARGWSYQEQFEVRQKGQVVFKSTSTADNTRYVWNYCLEYEEVEIELFDEFNDGWAPNSYVAVYEENGYLLGKWWMPTTPAGTKYIKTINLNYQVRKESEWKVSTSSQSSNWNYIEFNDASWQTAKKSSIPNYAGNTIFLRKSIEIDDPTKYPVFDFSIYMYEGVVIYWNGQEVYYKNLPQVHNQNTLANTKYEGYYYRRGSVPSYLFKQGQNVISVELHRSASTVTQVDFDFFGSLLQGSCINRIDSYTVTNSGAFNMPFESPEQAFDNDPTTKWLEDGLPASISIQFNFDRQDFINKIQLYSANDAAERDPRTFTLKGTNDNGATWTTLLTVDQKNIWTERQQMREWWITDSLQTFNTYKLEITAVQGSVSRTQLSEIKLFSCHLVYCMPENNWVSAQSGTTITRDCPAESIGEQTRRCSEAALKPVWLAVDSSNCKSLLPPSGKAYVDTLIRIKGPTLEGMNNGGLATLKMVMSSIFGISSNDVETWLLKDSSAGSKDSIITSYVRLIVPKDNGDANALLLAGSGMNIANLLKQNNKNVFPDTTEVSFDKSPVVSKPQSLSAGIITLIVILSILAVFAVVIIVACVFFRLKKTNKKGTKKLNDHVAKKTPAKNNTVRV
ncbi:hypothetical protein WA158_004477 [Blastocystis sp. Blastoise]